MQVISQSRQAKERIGQFFRQRWQRGHTDDGKSPPSSGPQAVQADRQQSEVSSVVHTPLYTPGITLLLPQHLIPESRR